jgi:penicillin-binding protein 1C
LVEITIDPRTGKRVPADAENARRDLVPADQVPPAATPADYDANGRALLDSSYAEWFASHHNFRRNELVLGAALTQEKLRIISPADNATFLLDPEIPSGSAKLRPVTNLPGTARWESATLRIEPARPEPIIHLTPGTHTLIATDPATGVIHSLTLRVKSL